MVFCLCSLLFLGLNYLNGNDAGPPSWRLIQCRAINAMDNNGERPPLDRPLVIGYTPLKPGFYGVLAPGPLNDSQWKKWRLRLLSSEDITLIASAEDKEGREYIRILGLKGGIPALMDLDPRGFRLRGGDGNLGHWGRARGVAFADYTAFIRPRRAITHLTLALESRNKEPGGTTGEKTVAPAVDIPLYATDLYLINPRIKGIKQITATPKCSETHPSPSPDGKTILFTALFTDRDENGRLSPGGPDALDSRLGVVGIDGSDYRLLEIAEGCGYGCFIDNGAKILFSQKGANPKKGSLGIYEFASRKTTILPMKRDLPRFLDPSVTEDKLFFIAPTHGRQAIFTRRLQGGEAVPLLTLEEDTLFHGPRLHPRGRWLTFATSPRDTLKNVRRNWDLSLLDMEEGRLETLTHGPFQDSEPQWTRDGKAILFSRRDPKTGQTGIYQVSLPDLHTTPLAVLPKPELQMAVEVNAMGDIVAAGLNDPAR